MGPFARLLLGLALSFLVQLIFPAPQPRIRSANDVTIPPARRGTPVWKIYGTVWVAPEIVWDGDFAKKAIKKGGGLFTRSQTVGYKYYKGWHGILSMAPIDAILEIQFDKKMVWRGRQEASGQIKFRASKVFDEAGSMSGTIDYLDGNDTQGVNDYLSAKTTAPVPGFRGVASLVHRKLEVGQAASLRPERVKAVNVFSTADNWLPEFAPICPAIEEGASLYIAVDNSVSMYEGSPTPMSVQKTALLALIESLRGKSVIVRMVAFSDDVDTSITQTGPGDAAFDALASWVNGLSSGGTNTGNLVPPYTTVTKLSRGGNDWKELGKESAIGQWVLTTQSPFEVSSYNAITTAPIADVFPQFNNNSDIAIHTVIDASLIGNGATLTLSDQVTAYGSSASFNPAVTSRVEMIGYTQAQWDAGATTGNTFFGVTQTLAANHPTDGSTVVYPRTAVGTVDSDDYAYIRIMVTPFDKFYAADINGTYLFYAGLQNGTLTGPFEGTDYEAGVSLAPDFFSGVSTGSSVESDGDVGRFLDTLLDADEASTTETPYVMLFLSDGVPSPTSSATAAQTIVQALPSQVRSYAFNVIGTDTTYTSMIDNTDADGVPVLSDGDQLHVNLLARFVSYVDINWAHVIRDLLIDPDLGGEFTSADIGASFATTAETLFTEGMGMSGRIDPAQFDETRQAAEEHVDGVIEWDETTGKWEFYIVRNDYTVGNLPVIEDLKDWGEVSRPLQSELPSSVTVTFRDRDTWETASVTSVNDAAAQVVGLSPLAREYDYITCPELAERVAARDRSAKTVPLWQGNGSRVPYLAPTLRRGRPFVANEPEIGLGSIVARILRYKEDEAGGYIVDWVEDRFDLPADAYTIIPGVTTPSTAALAPNVRWVEELPYFLAVQQYGAAYVGSLLASDSGYGLIAVTSDSPGDLHLNAIIADQSGASWVDIGDAEFSPAAQLTSGMDAAADTVTFTVAYNSTLDNITGTDLVQIGPEIMRVDNVVKAGSVVTVTVGRGALDTVPADHAVGDWALFFTSGLSLVDQTYTAADTEALKLLPVTTRAVLSPDDAATDSVTLASRMARPKPAGNVQVDGSYLGGSVFDGSASVTWSRTNKLTDITYPPADFADADVTPEAGTTVTIRLYWRDGTGALISTTDVAPGMTGTSYTLTDVTAQPANTAIIGIAPVTVLGGLEAWQSREVQIYAATARTTHTGAIRTTHDGKIRTIHT